VTLGIIKIIFGFLLLTVLYPNDCANFSDFYGVIAILIGLQWICYGNQVILIGLQWICYRNQVASSAPPAGAVAIPATSIEKENVHPMDINIAPEQMQEVGSDTKLCYSDRCTSDDIIRGSLV
jgi:hypothetical protein